MKNNETNKQLCKAGEILPAGKHAQHGFTLIELSIVLVIIGLIIGGVLVGQDMIKAAQIRATIGQFEKYDAAVNTFRNKYNGLPGDLANAANFFNAATDLPDSTTNCTKPAAGNGTLDDCTDTLGTRVLLSGEPAAFWRQLYLANLIADPITDTKLIGGTGAAVNSPGNVGNAFPAAKSGGFIFAYTGGSAIPQAGMAGTNLYRLAGGSFSNTGAPTFTQSLTPLQALAIDGKKDDGVPGSGTVQATDTTTTTTFNVGGGTPDTFTPGANACVFTGGTSYNTSVSVASGTAQGNNTLCELLLRASW